MWPAHLALIEIIHNKIEGGVGVLRGVLYKHYQGVLYFQNGIRVCYTRVDMNYTSMKIYLSLADFHNSRVLNSTKCRFLIKNFTQIGQQVSSLTNTNLCTPVAKCGFPYSDFHGVRYQYIGLQLCRHLVQNFIQVTLRQLAVLLLLSDLLLLSNVLIALSRSKDGWDETLKSTRNYALHYWLVWEKHRS
jgi:hypothetical protein